MKELYQRFKKITGYKYTDIARYFSISKQAVDQSMKNYSTTYLNSNKFMLTQMCDLKIEELEREIKEIKEFKKGIISYRGDK